MVLHTAYFPSVEWLRTASRGASIEAHENFQKQTPRNRCQIMTANGIMTLVVPYVHNQGQKIPIKDLRVDRSTPWQRTHLRALTAAYRSAPYWEHFQERITPLFHLQDEFLWDLNLKTIETLSNALKLPLDITPTNQFQGAQEPPIAKEEPYIQVFSDRHPFAPNLSALDALFCLGRLPNAE